MSRIYNVVIYLLVSILVIAIGLVIYSVFYPKTHADECTPFDRIGNICIPAGKCHLPGEETFRGVIIKDGCLGSEKNYDHTR